MSAKSESGPRYALYFVPAEENALYRFGASFLGYDCYTGRDIDHPSESGWDADTWTELTHAPRVYGFHATLKAPFFLSADCTEAGLVERFEEFAGRTRSLPAYETAIRTMDGFNAITTLEPQPELGELAAQCVIAFDDFRAPMTERERNRRMQAHLTDRQIVYLNRWGYPHVFGDFRFHLTLTRTLPADAAMTLSPAMKKMADGCTHSCHIDRLSLMKQADPAGRFRILRQAMMTGA